MSNLLFQRKYQGFWIPKSSNQNHQGCWIAWHAGKHGNAKLESEEIDKKRKTKRIKSHNCKMLKGKMDLNLSIKSNVYRSIWYKWKLNINLLWKFDTLKKLGIILSSTTIFSFYFKYQTLYFSPQNPFKTYYQSHTLPLSPTQSLFSPSILFLWFQPSFFFFSSQSEKCCCCCSGWTNITTGFVGMV